MKTSKSFVLASEVRTATAGAHVQEQTLTDCKLCFVFVVLMNSSQWNLQNHPPENVRRVSIFLTLFYTMLFPI